MKLTGSLIITLFMLTSLSVRADESLTIQPLANRQGTLSEKEVKDLEKIKSSAREDGLLVPSSDISKWVELTIRPALFDSSESSVVAKEMEERLLKSYDHLLIQAMNDWRIAHVEVTAKFVDFRLVSILKTGFKVKMPTDSSPEAIAIIHSTLQEKYTNLGGICTADEKGTDLKIICLNLTFRRIGEAMTDEIKTITSSVKGHDTQAGGTVCTAAGCGTYRSATVKQMDASSSHAVKTGKKIKSVQTRLYIDRAEIEALDQIKINDFN